MATLYCHFIVEVRDITPEEDDAKDMFAADVKTAMRVYLYDNLADNRWNVWIDEVEIDES